MSSTSVACLMVWPFYHLMMFVTTLQKDSNHLLITSTLHMCLVDIFAYSHHHVQMGLFHLFVYAGCHLPMSLPSGTSMTSPWLEALEQTTSAKGGTNAFMKLVGHAHPTIWRAIDSLRKDQALVATALLRDHRGDPPAKRRRRHTVTLQAKLHKLCSDRSQDIKTIPEVLRGVGHCVRWK